MSDGWKEAEKGWKEAAEAWKRVPDAMASGALMGAATGTIIAFVLIVIMFVTGWHP